MGVPRSVPVPIRGSLVKNASPKLTEAHGRLECSPGKNDSVDFGELKPIRSLYEYWDLANRRCQTGSHPASIRGSSAGSELGSHSARHMERYRQLSRCLRSPSEMDHSRPCPSIHNDRDSGAAAHPADNRGRPAATNYR